MSFGYTRWVGALAVLVLVLGWTPQSVRAQDGIKQAPIFEVDPYWPKPLPNHWIMGTVTSMTVDAQDHIWVVHRPSFVEESFKAADSNPSVGACCHVAPPVLVFDKAGNLLKSWGGPGEGYEWTERTKGVMVDSKGVVWIGGNGDKDTRILRFNTDGKFLSQIGKYGVKNSSNDTDNFGRPASFYEDVAANEVYVADGYANRRIVVLDRDSGKYKRHWGAYGTRPSDEKVPEYHPGEPPSKNFGTVHCVDVSKDGFVYVCDRPNDRIQVFRKDGTFVKEVFLDPKTLKNGSVWDLTFSRDPQQTYLYVANGIDQKISIINRGTMEVLTSFGDGGRQPGQFYNVGTLGTDSQGNLYTAETFGSRVQRFVFKGVGPVTKAAQGVLWPKNQ